MKKSLLLVLFNSIIFLAAMTSGVALADGGEPSVKIIKLNFVPVSGVAAVLQQMKGPEGKVIANEEAQSVVLMDTPDHIKAMEALVRQMDIQTVTIRIPLQFSRANEVLDSVRGLLTQSVGAITADMKENTITVTDTAAVVEKVRRDVETLDSHGRKIILEVKLVHVLLDDEHLDGVDWTGIVADHQNFRLEGRWGFLGGKGQGESLSLGTIEGPDFVPLIEALDTVGIVKEYPVSDVLLTSDSEVRMTVRLDEPEVSLEVPAPEAGEASSANGVTAEFVLRPQVDVDGTLKTVIFAREPAVPGRASDKAKAAIHLAMLDRQPRSVTVRSLEGGSIVLGGLIATEQVLTQRKIPLIGDLPLLGFAFRYHNSSVRREEFVILLTPRIVTPQAPESGVEALKAAVN